jgi:hypothetical protein
MNRYAKQWGQFALLLAGPKFIQKMFSNLVLGGQWAQRAARRGNILFDTNKHM